jgi:iron complex outermembrane receptor protein
MDRHYGGQFWILSVICTVTLLHSAANAQEVGVIRGAVTFGDAAEPVHGATVLVVGPSLVTLTEEDGTFEIAGVPPGAYEVIAQREHLSAERQTVLVVPGADVTVNFALAWRTVHEELTVTATASGQTTAFDAFNAISTLDSFELISNPQSTLGDALEHEPGVAKRSYGPGSSRPIIRGFDGDRVLIMEDGIRTGDLGSQSGDHGVSIDPNGLARIEIVRGPATLLYGSNAVGGVVNAITPHASYLDSMTDGARGQVSADTGSADQQAGTNASMQYTDGHAILWLGGGTRATDDYRTPLGTIENSATQLHSARAGIGYFGGRLFASGGFTAENGLFGVPFVGELPSPDRGEDDAEGPNTLDDDVRVELDSRRRVGRFDVGMRNLNHAVVDGVRLTFNVVDWSHIEVESEDGAKNLGTAFDNRTYVVRAEVDQRQTARLAGKFGLWTQTRHFVALGEEALAPPTDQTSLAAFVYEELDFGRFRAQLGGRLERNGYTVAPRDAVATAPGGPTAPDVRDRDFNGGSFSAGLQADLGSNAAFVTNVTRSHRAPALEELYNFGPHVGNLVFEVGNPDLGSETTVGLDVSLRYQSARAKSSINAYVYDIDDFVFASITGAVADRLRVAEFRQADGRFVGFDGDASVRVGGATWINVGVGFVDAELKTGEALPRIPPLRGRVSVDLPYRGFTLSPELLVAARQGQVFRDESETSGYSVFNLRASYVLARPHVAHIFSVSGYNMTNELYRNHTSFIKDFAPEIGRGVTLGYSVRFF